MPITLSPVSRRRFLQNALAVGAAAAAGMPMFRQAFSREGKSASPRRNPNALAFMSDIHIHKNKEHVVHDLCVFDRFTRAREMIFGDCAYGVGLKEDYATMLEGFDPINIRLRQDLKTSTPCRHSGDRPTIFPAILRRCR